MSKDLLRGIVIGLANIIPGVSGGTLALVLGIYERLVNALNSLTAAPLLRAAGNCLLLRPGAFTRLWQEMKAADCLFLIRIGAGAVIAILAASRVIAAALEHHYAASYGFFFGLVALSVIYPLRYMRRSGLREKLAMLAAVGMLFMINGLMSEETRIERAEKREAIRTERAVLAETQAVETESRSFISLELPEPARVLFIFAALALALSAMVLPGVSGSFVLLLLGVYFDILIAVNERQVLVLLVAGLGAGTGLIFFAKIMSRLLAAWHDTTMAFMAGLMAASLINLWPFKRSVVIGTQTVYLGNYLPREFGGHELLVLGCIAAGAGLVFAGLLLERCFGKVRGR